MCDCNIHVKLYKHIANWIINDGLALCHKYKVPAAEIEKRIPPALLKEVMLRTMHPTEQLHILQESL